MSRAELAVTFEGRTLTGEVGQTLAGVLLANGVREWRTTSVSGEPRGLFCGIGVCFDCVLVVDGESDVRACQRLATDGAVLQRQHDQLPHQQDDQLLERSTERAR